MSFVFKITFFALLEIWGSRVIPWEWISKLVICVTGHTTDTLSLLWLVVEFEDHGTCHSWWPPGVRECCIWNGSTAQKYRGMSSSWCKAGLGLGRNRRLLDDHNFALCLVQVWMVAIFFLDMPWHVLISPIRRRKIKRA